VPQSFAEKRRQSDGVPVAVEECGRHLAVRRAAGDGQHLTRPERIDLVGQPAGDLVQREPFAAALLEAAEVGDRLEVDRLDDVAVFKTKANDVAEFVVVDARDDRRNEHDRQVRLATGLDSGVFLLD